ncbi:unnamed protein product [Darwinula stevensoni]|uniref:Uncharacterized protein n=1 Tax=Darwinula stevensoni TaxID=69355 RepID=A0A7R8X8G3_9CRUS|nr:unnamed protein product [Darwinula stevensoni]CAG0889657.1 unnamed protein product [Darwinula stevensoni]
MFNMADDSSKTDEEPHERPQAKCRDCPELSKLGRLQSSKWRGNSNFLGCLKIYMGADDESPLKKAAGEYATEHISVAYNKGFSLPERCTWNSRECIEPGKWGEGPAVSKVFERLEEALKDKPSLTVADFAFMDNFLAGIKKERRDEFSDLQNSIHCRDCISQILTSEDINDQESFRKFLDRSGIAFEKLWDNNSKSSVMKTFKDVFDLCVCAASVVDLPRHSTHALISSHEQSEKLLILLTPQQRQLVKSDSEVLLMSGAVGTGKTVVLKKRAEELAKNGEVLLINLAGGLLTCDFRSHFAEMAKVKVIDGREEGLQGDLEALKKFLSERGKGKHVLLDEVPITLGFQSSITVDTISNQWGWIEDAKSFVKSITVSFRSNDPSDVNDYLCRDVKLGQQDLTILNIVKRNKKHISELIAGIRNFPKNISPLHEGSRVKEVEKSREAGLPSLFPIPSCQALHFECRDNAICEAIRASSSIHIIYEKQSESSKRMPLFVVVDDKKKRNALVNIFTSFYSDVPVLFLHSIESKDTNYLDVTTEPDDFGGTNDKFYDALDYFYDANGDFDVTHDLDDSDRAEFLGNLVSEKSFPIVFVTEEELMGCHPKNLTVVVDFPHSHWKNYERMTATASDSMIILVEKENQHNGQYYHGQKEMDGIMITADKINEANLNMRLGKALETYEGGEINDLKKVFIPAPFPLMIGDELGGWEGGEEEDVEKILVSRISGIFGEPASGKSRRVDMLIRQVTGLGESVLLLHPGCKLSLEAYRRRWEDSASVNIRCFESRKIKSLQDIFDLVKRVKNTLKKEDSEDNQKPEFQVVVVEDCPLRIEFGGTLQECESMRLILAFEPHSGDAPTETMERAKAFLEQNPRQCSAIVPTWNDTAERIGKEAVMSLLDKDSGAILSLPPEAWEELNIIAPLPSLSSPFFEWAYAWNAQNRSNKFRAPSPRGCGEH